MRFTKKTRRHGSPHTCWPVRNRSGRRCYYVDMVKMIKPLIVIAVAVAVAIALAVFLSRESSTSTSASSMPSGSLDFSGGRVRGPADAPVKLIEFGDYQCPSCGFYAPIVLEILRRYPNQVQLEFRHYPIVNIHQWAMPAAMAAEAAGDQGKFWEMHDLLYQNQEKWSRSPNAESEFLSYAAQLALNINQFMQGTRSPSVQQRIMKDVTFAVENKVDATPTFFINGEKVRTNPRNASEFSKLIEAELAKKGLRAPA